jgi:CRP/FNR family cyclic AMP-dependent transcriptional regulator
MTHDRLLSFLSGQRLFRGLDSGEIDRVVRRMEVVDVADGQRIFAEGEPGDAWYVITKGAVVILKSTVSGPEHELARLERGEEFGEMALIDDAPRLASAVADGPASLARLPSGAFRALLDEESGVGGKVVLAMARVLCQRQRELTAVLTDLVDDPDTAAPGAREMLSMLLLSPK